MEALRDYARTNLAKVVPERPYAKNIEKAAWLWAVEESKKNGEHDTKRLRSRYKHKVIHLMSELTRDPSWVQVDMRVGEHGVKLQFTTLPQLLHRLLIKEVSSQDLVRLPAEALWPEGPKAQAIFKAVTKDMKLEAIKAKENEDYNGLFRCKKCRTNKVTYTQAQTRSADGAFYSRVLLLLLTDAAVQNP